MEIFEALKGWISRSGAPWRPYPDAEDVFAGAGEALETSLPRTDGSRRSPVRQVAANDASLCTCDAPGIAKINASINHGEPCD